MVNEYKKLALLKGLELINDYHFRVIKSLLAHDLKLTKKMQDDYDRITIADLMEAKFPDDAGVGKLTEFFREIPELTNLAESLKKEKAKVKRRSKGKEKTTAKKAKQDEPSAAQPTSTTNKDLEPESSKNRPLTKEKKIQTRKTKDSKRMPHTQEQGQLPEPLATSTQQTAGYPQILRTSPPTPSTSFSSKRQVDTVTKKHDIMRTQVSMGKPELPELSVPIRCPAVSGPQSSQMLPAIASSSLQPPQMLLVTASSSLQPPQMPPATASSSHLPKKPRSKTLPKKPSIEDGYQQGSKEVMVLKAAKPFTYDFREREQKMFHATVATESEFFRVKVFDISLKDKFIPNKIIAISEYFGRNGFLEIYSAHWVSDVNADRKMHVSPTLRNYANATPKIKDLCEQRQGTFVNGIFQVHKKIVRNECTYYEIQDNTGKMEVVLYGRLTNTDCKEGDKLKLFCFELNSSVDKWQLRSVIHSDIQVIKARKTKTEPLQPDSNRGISLESFFFKHECH